jgi:hypothetical protein
MPQPQSAAEIFTVKMQEGQHQVVAGQVEASTGTAENKGGLQQIGECHVKDEQLSSCSKNSHVC